MQATHDSTIMIEVHGYVHYMDISNGNIPACKLETFQYMVGLDADGKITECRNGWTPSFALMADTGLIARLQTEVDKRHS